MFVVLFCIENGNNGTKKMSNCPYDVQHDFYHHISKACCKKRNMFEKKIFYQAVLMRRTLRGFHNYQFYLPKEKYISKEILSVTDS